ncbi:MAG: CZB domain-containing protein [Rhodoferax sp.]|nr:CZB domain-containing protein [Rhodoferax sp.]
MLAFTPNRKKGRPMSDSLPSSIDTLNRAFAQLQNWKTLRLESMAAGVAPDVATIRRDDCCELGRWLHSEGARIHGNKPEFQDLLSKHASFHQVAAVAVGKVMVLPPDEAVTTLCGCSVSGTAASNAAMAVLALKRRLVDADNPVT